MTEENRPSFRSEEEEAAWLYGHRQQRDEVFAKAIREGHARRSTLEQRVAESLKIQLDSDDAAKAMQIAESRGLEYKSYVKALIHQALLQELAGS